MKVGALHRLAERGVLFGKRDVLDVRGHDDRCTLGRGGVEEPLHRVVEREGVELVTPEGNATWRRRRGARWRILSPGPTPFHWRYRTPTVNRQKKSADVAQTERTGCESPPRYDATWGEIPAGSLQQLWPNYVQGPVVELGAASGRNRDLLSPQTKWSGLEFDRELVELGRAKGAEVIQCDLNSATELSLHADVLRSARTVLALDVLEHLDDPRQVIHSINAITASECPRWVISVPNVAFLTARLDIVRGRFPKDPRGGIFDDTHRHFFTYETVRDWLVPALAATSFEIVPCAFPVAGNRLRSNAVGRRALPWLRRLAARSADLRPTVFAYEWLVVADAR